MDEAPRSNLGKEVHRWSGQVLDTIDYCAFIGRNPGSKYVYVVTGDSGQGMTHGALAGLLLKDLIGMGRAHGKRSMSRRARRPPDSSTMSERIYPRLKIWPST